MSCSIDVRNDLTAAKMSSQRKCGSILMEFVLVLPLYITLLGGMFLIGDIGLDAIRVSVGDRDAALDAGDRIGRSIEPFKAKQMGQEGYNVTVRSRTYRADESFQGAWSWLAAGRSYSSYKLRAGGSILISYPFLHYGDSSSGGGLLSTLVGGGSVTFHGKDFSLNVGTVRSYNYYTLKRTDLARSNNAYRNWDSDRLVLFSEGKQYWDGKVYEETFADANGENLDLSGQSANDTLPDVPNGAGEYGRYSQFVEWSE